MLHGEGGERVVRVRGVTPRALAREVDRLQAENHRLRRRVRELEGQRDRLLQRLRRASPASRREPAPWFAEAPAATEEELMVEVRALGEAEPSFVPGPPIATSAFGERLPDCPTCGGRVDSVEQLRTLGAHMADPCGHLVQVTIWPDALHRRVELKPASPA